jgi:hypothetical protein
MQSQEPNVTDFLSRPVTYEANITLGIGPHSYYFDASNGGGSACFDKNGSHTSAPTATDTVKSVSGLTITGNTHGWPSDTNSVKDYQLTFTDGQLSGKTYTIASSDSASVTLASGSNLTGWGDGEGLQINWIKPEPILGPWVNDPPVLSNAAVTPSGNISPNQQVVYSVRYSEGGGNPPEGGFPTVYVDSKPVSVYAVASTACQGIVAGGGNSSVTMSGAWPSSTFAGQSLCVQSGLARGKAYLIKASAPSADGLSTILTLEDNADIVKDGFVTGDSFRVGVEVTQVNGNVITDDAQKWSTDPGSDLTGAAVRFSGVASSKFYVVGSYTQNTLSLLEPDDATAADLAVDGVKIGDRIVIGGHNKLKDGASLSGAEAQEGGK